MPNAKRRNGVVGTAGLEPATCHFKGDNHHPTAPVGQKRRRCFLLLCQLSYVPVTNAECVVLMGARLGGGRTRTCKSNGCDKHHPTARKARYRRCSVRLPDSRRPSAHNGAYGFWPSSFRHASQSLSHCAWGGVRSHGLLLFRQALLPAELPKQKQTSGLGGEA
jgi:hypothetical protein